MEKRGLGLQKIKIKDKILDNCLVVTFSMSERTEELNDLCFQKLGFKNRITLSTSDGFHDKFLKFAELACKSEYDFFIRNDADRLVFSGILNLLDMMIKDERLSWTTGTYYDYLMNRFRCGTPSIHRRDNLQFLVDNPSLMKDVQKPEATFANSIKDKFKIRDVEIFTNLHEYDQYPSKVCNAFLNRLCRGHYPRLYDDNYLNGLPEHYKRAVKHAFTIYDRDGPKNSIKFKDFSFLDQNIEPLEERDLETLYRTYENLYQKLRGSKE